MSGGDARPARYQDVFAHPLARRLCVADAISYLGDFVGLGALLLVAYDRSGGRPLGPAAVFGVQAIPAVLVATGIGPWLDRIPRISGLASLCLIGAAALSLPLIFGGLWPVLATAAIIGSVRTAYNSIRSGAMADGVPQTIRGRLLALNNVSYSVCEVLGYFAGSTVALVTGAKPAIIADAVTFLVAAGLFTGLAEPLRSARRRRSSLTTGIRTIFRDPTLAMLVPVIWAGLTLGAVPATLATTALRGSYRGWVPLAMAAMAVGLAIAGVAVGRSDMAEHVPGQLRYIVAEGALFLLVAFGLKLTPLLIVAGNFAVGAGMGWTVAAQTTFVLVVPPDRIAHVTSMMVASLIVLEGAGAVVFGAVANSLGVPAAYLLAGVMMVVAGVTGTLYARRQPAALDVTRSHNLPVVATAATPPPARSPRRS
ncbi:MAG TPA: MFS transporter [Streptosporangiaceae bacterium]|nr:MFS transporter [Streptosporangiaceae bacterium]